MKRPSQMELNKQLFTNELKMASVRVDITDIGEKTYRGFSLKECEIVDRIEAKITYLQSDGQKFIWVSLDECSMRSRSADQVVRLLSSNLDIPTSHIMMTCVHTHSAHNTGFIDLQMLAEILEKGALTAEKKLVTVTSIRQTIGQVEHIVNRRVELPKDLGGYCVMFNNQCLVDEEKTKIDATEQIEQYLQKNEGEGFVGLEGFKEYILGKNFDSRIHMWEFLDKNEITITAIIRVNAHPVIVSQSRVGAKVSVDFVRVLENLVEKELNCVCALFNGAFGDTRPITNQYSFEDREKFAGRYFAALKKGISSKQPYTNFTWYEFKDVKVQLRDEMPRSIEGLKSLRDTIHARIKDKIGPMKKNHDLLETTEGFLLDNGNIPSAIVSSKEVMNGFAEYQINGWAIGPMKILALPGEPLTEFAKAIEKFSGVLPIGLANGYLSYLPDPSLLSKGGYEVNQCVLNKNGLNELINLGSHF